MSILWLLKLLRQNFNINPASVKSGVRAIKPPEKFYIRPFVLKHRKYSSTNVRSRAISSFVWYFLTFGQLSEDPLF